MIVVFQQYHDENKLLIDAIIMIYVL
jgi:hypothetical protein